VPHKEPQSTPVKAPTAVLGETTFCRRARKTRFLRRVNSFRKAQFGPLAAGNGIPCCGDCWPNRLRRRTTCSQSQNSSENNIECPGQKGRLYVAAVWNDWTVKLSGPNCMLPRQKSNRSPIRARKLAPVGFVDGWVSEMKKSQLRPQMHCLGEKR
jgi:hypothetical protein